MKDTDYVSFLLRLWLAEEDGYWIWRASLESAQTGEKRKFATVSVMMEYLEREYGQPKRENEEANL